MHSTLTTLLRSLALMCLVLVVACASSSPQHNSSENIAQTAQPTSEPSSVPASKPSDASIKGSPLAIAQATGMSNWKHVKRVQFTWTLASKNIARSYDWNTVSNRVKVTNNTQVVTVNLDAPKKEHEASWKHFINDSYWLLFEQHLVWDKGVAFAELAANALDVSVQGTTRGLDVRYGQVGPTPGDRYVVLIGEGDTPVGWTFYKQNAAQPSVTTTRERWVTQAGMTVPTLFATPDGKALITITDLTISR